MHLILHTDGGSRGNPGPAGAGVVLLDADTGQTRHEAGFFLGSMTSNQAEYEALLRGLDAARELGATRISLRADSELMVRQLNGQYKVKASHLKPLYQKAMKSLYSFKEEPRIEHIRRELNERADELANLAMDRRLDYVVPGGDVASRVDEHAASTTTDLPAFTATLAATRSRGARSCIAGQSTGTPHHFGPRTPESVCLHAAAAALGPDGPLAWLPSKRRGETRCHACGLRITLEKLPTSTGGSVPRG